MNIKSIDTNISGIDLIQNHLNKYEWAYELIDPNTIITGFSTEESIFTLFISCNDDICFFSIPNFASSPNKDCTLNAYRYLLETNLRLICGKFALDEEGKIGLFAEFPISVMSYDFFSFILYSMSINAEEHLSNVSEVSQNPNFVSPYTKLGS